MDNGSLVYRDLQMHLNKGPIGYPATESGGDIRLLKHLFTPEEAKIATLCSTVRLEPVSRIYDRARKRGMPILKEELELVLDRMMRKGIILAYREGFSEMRYKNAGVSAGGIYDFQVNRLTEDLIRDFHEYHSEAFAKVETTGTIKIPQLRTVPVERSIPTPESYEVKTYDNARHLVEAARGPIAVANCVCRQTKDLQQQSCSFTDLRETCLQIGGDHARQYVEMGIGRYITKVEAFTILSRAEQAGLVLQPENSKKPEAICCCCGDCCGLLSAVQKHPRPVELYASNYYAEVDSELCIGCGTCVDRCQLKAMFLDKGKSVVNTDRCIGCGNCVVTCQQHATGLRKKSKEFVPPENKNSMFRKIVLAKKANRTADSRI